MKIKSIEYSNFRNFRNKGKIEFDTDGKITVIYGENGDGKTTLHQLFQWILYGNTSFNKTATKKMYNLSYAESIANSEPFYVYGQMELIHNNEDYLVRREWQYKKAPSGTITQRTEGSSFLLQKKDEKGNWKKLEHPDLVIEDMLPSGLSPYFFFDGETMIADLKTNGKESASKLKKALFSIFELDYLEEALADLGDPNRRKSGTVFGILKDEKARLEEKHTEDVKERENLKYINMLEKKIEEHKERLEKLKKQYRDNESTRTKISEKIGKKQATKELEDIRQDYDNQIEVFEECCQKEKNEFGKEITNNYSYLLVSKTAENAKERLYLEVQQEDEKIPKDLAKALLKELLHSKTCICGNPIHKNEKECFEKWLACFPPASYKSTYARYKAYMDKYQTDYDPENLEEHFKKQIYYNDKIREYRKKIKEIDEKIKDNDAVDDLIEQRQKIETENAELSDEIEIEQSELGNAQHQLKLRKRNQKKIDTKAKDLEAINAKIKIAEEVYEELQNRLRDETNEYTDGLRTSIQQLIEEMLTSKRSVDLTKDFQLQVTDSHGDESKSEGQFAVVSFAYIIGILKVLKQYGNLKEKEYPLVLDGPFSKLDATQKNNVLTTIPQYVPQTIIFSKDPLDDILDDGEIGQVWTIESNEEKNKAKVVKEEPSWK